MATSSRELEQLVAKIQRQLAPHAEVLHDVRLPGRHTGGSRQIDVLVHDRVGQYDIKIVIDCKDHKTPVDVKGVEEFEGLLDDVGAQKGVLVCPSGFTAMAKKRAEGFQIDLYSPVDTDSHKWTVKVTVPAIVDYRSALMAFGLGVTTPLPFQCWPDFYQVEPIFAASGAELGKTIEEAARKWNDAEFPDETGLHSNLPVFGDQKTLMNNGRGTHVEVDLWVDMEVRQELYFGQLPIPRISGFRDERTGLVITNAFEVGWVDPEEVEKTWLKIDDLSKAPIRPVLSLIGRMAWDVTPK